MADERTVEQFVRLLGSQCRTRIRHATAIADFIGARSEADQTELMRELIEKCDAPGIKNPNVVDGRDIPEDKREKIANMLEQVVAGNLKMIILQRKTPEQAAKILRDLVFGFVDEEREWVLWRIMDDVAIPYTPAPESDMPEFNDDTMQLVASRHCMERNQLCSVLRGGFPQTVTADMILKVLESVEPYEDRVGMMQVFLNLILRLAVPG